MLMPSSSPSMDEDSCCTVLAIRCGPRQMKESSISGSECSEEDKVERGELTIMMGIGPMSPSLHRDVELYHQKKQMDSDMDDNGQQSSSNTTNITAIPSFYKPLQLPDQSASPSPSSSSEAITGSSTSTSDMINCSIIDLFVCQSDK